MSDIEPLELEMRDGGIRSESFQHDSLVNDTEEGLNNKEFRLAKILANRKIDDERYWKFRRDARKALLAVQIEINRREEKAAARRAIVKQVLCISTIHVPSDLPDWGDRDVLHPDQGWLIFAYPESAEGVPAWLQEVDSLAADLDCRFIWFDCDGIQFDELPRYSWEWTADDPKAGAVGSLTVRDGDALAGVLSHLSKIDKNTLVDAVADIIARTGYDEEDNYDETMQVSGADLFDSIRFTLRTKLKITYP